MNAITDRVTRSWQLFKRSILVLRDHPKLLVFPLVTGMLTVGIALFFLAPVALALLAPHWLEGSTIQSMAHRLNLPRFQQFGGNLQFELKPVWTAMLAGLYLLDMFLATLGSVAFTSEILEALNGRSVSIRHGIETACRRWKSVLCWSLFAGFVGLAIKALEERLSIFGRLIAGLIGLAWSVAAIFTIPILVREENVVNPIKILTKSAATIKRTWGEMLTGYAGLQGLKLLFVWASLLYWGAMGATAYLVSNAWWLLFALGPWILSLVVYSYLAGIASRIYLCALYLYSATGVVAGHYDEAMMGMAWKVGKSS